MVRTVKSSRDQSDQKKIQDVTIVKRGRGRPRGVLNKPRPQQQPKPTKIEDEPAVTDMDTDDTMDSMNSSESGTIEEKSSIQGTYINQLKREYKKVMTLYKKKIEDHAYKNLKAISYVKPSVGQPFPDIGHGRSTLNPFHNSLIFKDDKNRKIAKLPVLTFSAYKAPPPMRYWTHTNINIVGKDERSLSHVPYFGDQECEDSTYTEELKQTFEEGVHGCKPAWETTFNDWILFKLVDAVLKKEDRKNSSLIFDIMQDVYTLFPNKNSARDLANNFADLVARFDSDKSNVRLNIYNHLGEFNAHYPHHIVQSSNISLLCKRCYAIDCMFHPTDVTANDVHIEKKDDDVAAFTEACGPYCFQTKLKGSPKRSPRKAGPSSLEETPKSEFTLHEKTIVDALITSNIKSPCYLAEYISNLSRESPKSCLDVWEYLQEHSQSELTNAYDEVRVQGECRKLLPITNEQNRIFRTIFKGKLHNQMPYRSCKHDGECSRENDCSCVENGLMCTKFCRCTTKCAIRFPGCRCKPGGCRGKQCACYYANWECDPDVCRDCNCQLHSESGHEVCRNISIQRGYQRKLYIGPSEIAGIGCFSEEALEKGDFIGEYTGEIISHDEAERRGKIYDKFRCSYLFTLNEDQTVDATRVGNIVRFVNHSKQPNCKAKVVVVNGDHHIGLFALTSIKPHEELFFDYSYNKSQLSEFVYKERNKKYRPGPSTTG